VVLHRLRQVKFVSVLIDDFTHSVRSRAFVVELLRSPGCLEVVGRELHFVTNVEHDFFSASLLHLSLLCFLYVFTESPMRLCQSLEGSVCLVLRLQM